MGAFSIGTSDFGDAIGEGYLGRCKDLVLVRSFDGDCDGRYQCGGCDGGVNGTGRGR